MGIVQRDPRRRLQSVVDEGHVADLRGSLLVQISGSTDVLAEIRQALEEALAAGGAAHDETEAVWHALVLLDDHGGAGLVDLSSREQDLVREFFLPHAHEDWRRALPQLLRACQWRDQRVRHHARIAVYVSPWGGSGPDVVGLVGWRMIHGLCRLMWRLYEVVYGIAVNRRHGSRHVTPRRAQREPGRQFDGHLLAVKSDC